MGWLTNLLKNALAQAAVEVLMPQLEVRIRAIVREEVKREFEAWLPRLREMWREDMQRMFEEVWLPRMQAMWREDMQRMFGEVWLPQMQALWRADMERQFEETWLPRLRAAWREDLFAEVRSIHERLDSLSTMVMQFAQLRAEEVQALSNLVRELAVEVRSLRSEIDRIKAHVGLS